MNVFQEYLDLKFSCYKKIMDSRVEYYKLKLSYLKSNTNLKKLEYTAKQAQLLEKIALDINVCETEFPYELSDENLLTEKLNAYFMGEMSQHFTSEEIKILL
jgi:hypothetical protein